MQNRTVEIWLSVHHNSAEINGMFKSWLSVHHNSAEINGLFKSWLSVHHISNVLCKYR